MRLQRSSGLVGHWKFDEKSGLILNDSSRYKNTGTITQGAGKWTDKGYYFDGAATYVDAGGDASVTSITNDMTIMYWINTSNLSTPRTPVSTRTGKNDFTVPYHFIFSSTISAFLLGNGAAQFYAQGPNIPLNTIIFVSGVVSGTNIKLYINSKLQPTEATFIGTRQTGTKLTIGAADATGTRLFMGWINEVRIYNCALTANEIKRYYNSTKHKYI